MSPGLGEARPQAARVLVGSVTLLGECVHLYAAGAPAVHAGRAVAAAVPQVAGVVQGAGRVVGVQGHGVAGPAGRQELVAVRIPEGRASGEGDGYPVALSCRGPWPAPLQLLQLAGRPICCHAPSDGAPKPGRPNVTITSDPTNTPQQNAQQSRFLAQSPGAPWADDSADAKIPGRVKPGRPPLHVTQHLH